MTRGRKAKPIAQRRREGNPGKRTLPDEIVLNSPPGLLMPLDMPPEAVALWNEFATILQQARIVDRVDSAALAAMCIQWARAEQARKVLKEKGIFTAGSMGQVVEHPALAIERQAHAMFLRLAEQYGLTPAARARIAAAGRLGRGGSDGESELRGIIEQEAVELED